LDKYLGDGLIAYFNSPVSQPDHAMRAIKCALDMRSELEVINDERKREKKDPIRMGIGVHTGTAIVGDIGAPHRREFTAIGTAVNMAARLEGLTKSLGHEIVVSESTVRLVNEMEWIDLGEQKVKGGSLPIRVFTPCGISQSM
jgi:adenylate cyclase